MRVTRLVRAILEAHESGFAAGYAKASDDITDRRPDVLVRVPLGGGACGWTQYPATPDTEIDIPPGVRRITIVRRHQEAYTQIFLDGGTVEP